MIPDECLAPEDDCNSNQSPDSCDIADGSSADCNGNGVPDECVDLEDDCNSNQTPDTCDIADSSSVDCWVPDGVPDECCPGDSSPGDDYVGELDLTRLLLNWGACADSCIEGIPTCQCPADFDRNCTVNAYDLALLLGHWGPCDS